MGVLTTLRATTKVVAYQNSRVNKDLSELRLATDEEIAGWASRKLFDTIKRLEATGYVTPNERARAQQLWGAFVRNAGKARELWSQYNSVDKSVFGHYCRDDGCDACSLKKKLKGIREEALSCDKYCTAKHDELLKVVMAGKPTKTAPTQRKRQADGQWLKLSGRTSVYKVGEAYAYDRPGMSANEKTRRRAAASAYLRGDEVEKVSAVFHCEGKAITVAPLAAEYRFRPVPKPKRHITSQQYQRVQKVKREAADILWAAGIMSMPKGQRLHALRESGAGFHAKYVDIVNAHYSEVKAAANVMRDRRIADQLMGRMHKERTTSSSSERVAYQSEVSAEWASFVGPRVEVDGAGNITSFSEMIHRRSIELRQAVATMRKAREDEVNKYRVVVSKPKVVPSKHKSVKDLKTRAELARLAELAESKVVNERMWRQIKWDIKNITKWNVKAKNPLLAQLLKDAEKELTEGTASMVYVAFNIVSSNKANKEIPKVLVGHMAKEPEKWALLELKFKLLAILVSTKDPVVREHIQMSLKAEVTAEHIKRAIRLLRERRREHYALEDIAKRESAKPKDKPTSIHQLNVVGHSLKSSEELPDVYVPRGVKLAEPTKVVVIDGYKYTIDAAILVKPTAFNGVGKGRFVGAIDVAKQNPAVENLKSGTIIYTEDNQMCSVITCSNGAGIYAVSGSKPVWSKACVSKKEHSSLIVSEPYKLVCVEGKEFYVNDTDRELGLFHGVPMHCIEKSRRPMYKRQHHHYVDYFSKTLADKITEFVHLGSKDGPRYKVSEDKAVSYSNDTKQLCIGQFKTINCKDLLVSGTPVYNTEGKVCSWITASVANMYVLTAFGDNVEVSVRNAETNVRKRSKLITYGSHEFETKPELLEYISSPTLAKSSVNIWLGPGQNICVENNGQEIFKYRTSLPIVATFHSRQINTQKMVAATIEVGRLKGEIDRMAAQMNATKAIVTAAAANTNSVMATAATSPKKKRNKPAKKKVSSLTSGILISLALAFLFTMVDSATVTKLVTGEITTVPTTRKVKTTTEDPERREIRELIAELESKTVFPEHPYLDMLNEMYNTTRVKRQVAVEDADECRPLLNELKTRDPTDLTLELLNRVSDCGSDIFNAQYEAFKKENDCSEKLQCRNRQSAKLSSITSIHQICWEHLNKVWEEFKDVNTGWKWEKCVMSFSANPNLIYSNLPRVERMLKLIQNYTEMSTEPLHQSVKLLSDCMQFILRHKEMLKVGVDLTKMTLATCRAEKGKLELVLEGFHTNNHMWSHENYQVRMSSCVEEGDWHHNNYLLNGNGESCQKGISEDETSEVECLHYDSGCLSGLHTNCGLGKNGIKLDGNTLKTESVGRESKCCTLGCFTKDQLYHSLTDQPMCSSCIAPFVGLLWSSECAVPKGVPTNLTELTVYSDKTVISTGDRHYVCTNKYDFRLCCGGQGPVKKGEPYTFIDKHCACKLGSKKYSDKFIDNIVKQSRTVVENTNSWILVILIGALFIMPKWVIVLFLLFVSFKACLGSCQIDQMIPVPMSSKHYMQDVGSELQVRMSVGDCIDVGDSTLELLGVTTTKKYAFVYSIPYKIKPVCTKFNWGCKGGKGDDVFKVPDTCKLNCTRGLYWEHNTHESSWSGSKCFMSGGVSTHVSSCFSIGEIGTQVQLYNVLEKRESVQVDFIEHSTGKTQKASLKLGEVTTTISTTSEQNSVTWPTYVAKRGGSNFCAFTTIDFSRTCHSPDILDPLKMTSDCLDIRKQWNATFKRYDVAWKEASFSDLVHNHFEECDSSLVFRQTLETLEVTTVAKTFVGSIVPKRFQSSLGILKCKEQPNVVGEPGISGYHKATVILVTTIEEKCKVNIVLEGCESVQGQQVVLNPNETTRLQYWCSREATGMCLVTGSSEWRVPTSVVKNYMPHVQSVTKWVEARWDETMGVVSPANILDMITSWDFMAIFDWLRSFFGGSFSKMVVTLVIAYLIFSCVVSFHVVYAVLLALLLLLVLKTDYVVADPIDTSVYALEAFLDKLGAEILVLFLMSQCTNMWRTKTKVVRILEVLIVFLLSLISVKLSVVMVLTTLSVHIILNRLSGNRNVLMSTTTLWPLEKIGCEVTKKIQVDAASLKLAKEELEAVLPDIQVSIARIAPKRKERTADAVTTENAVARLNTKQEAAKQGIELVRNTDVPLIKVSKFRLTSKEIGAVNCISGISYVVVYLNDESCWLKKHIEQNRLPFGYEEECCFDDWFYRKEKTRGRSYYSTPHISVNHTDGYVWSDKAFDLSYDDAVRWHGISSDKVTWATPTTKGVSSYERIIIDERYPAVLIPRVKEALSGTLVCDTRTGWLVGVVTGKYKDKTVITTPGENLSGENIESREIRPTSTSESSDSSRDSGPVATSSRIETAVFHKRAHKKTHKKRNLDADIEKGKKALDEELVRISKQLQEISMRNKTSTPQSAFQLDQYEKSQRLIATLEQEEDSEASLKVLETEAQNIEESFESTALRDLNNFRMNNQEAYRLFQSIVLKDLNHDGAANALDVIDWLNWVIKASRQLEGVSHSEKTIDMGSMLIKDFDPHSPMPTEKEFTQLCSENNQKTLLDFVRNSVLVNRRECPAQWNYLTSYRDCQNIPQFTIVVKEVSSMVKCTLHRDVITISGSGKYLQHHLEDMLNKIGGAGCKLVAVVLYVASEKMWEQVLISAEAAWDFHVIWITQKAYNEMKLRPHRYNRRNMYFNIAEIVNHAWKKRQFFTRASGVTLNSLKNWAQVPSIRQPRTLVSCDVKVAPDSVQITIDELFSADEIVCGKISTFCSTGSFVIVNNVLVTCYHCTYGSPVILNYLGGTIKWEKPFYQDKASDIVTYGGVVNFARAIPGEVVKMYDPVMDVAQAFIVTSGTTQLRGRDGVKFVRYRPITVRSSHSYTYADNPTYKGSSGSPLINHSGEVVGLYGLLKWETAHDEDGDHKVLLNVTPVDLKQNQVNDYFLRAAREAVEKYTRKELEGDYMMLCAPTGTGKTTTLVKEVAKLMPERSKILLMQPTTVAVINAYKRIVECLKKEAVSHISVEYTIGDQNDLNSDSWPEALTRPSVTIEIKTYGKARHSHSEFTKYSIVVLDEIHDTGNADVVFVDLLVQSKLHPWQIIKLTATPLNWSNAYVLNDGEEISTTKYSIDETIRIKKTEKEKDEAAGMLIISKSDISCVKHPVSIPRKPLYTGTTLFFVASVAETDQGVAWAQKNFTEGETRQAHALSSKKPFSSLNINPGDWIFSTDVAGQSITIPGLVCVVDFLAEIKPTVSLSMVNGVVDYQRRLCRRDISKQTQKQRKGRVGRTCDGFYICEDKHLMDAEQVPSSVIPEVAMRFLEHKIDLASVRDKLKETSAAGIMDMVSSYQWLHPQRLGLNKEFIDDYNKKGNRKRPIDMEQKLKDCVGVNGDPIWWYLSPCFSAEQEARAMSNHSVYGKGNTLVDSVNFFGQIKKYMYKCNTNKEVFDITNSNTNFSSFSEVSFSDSERELFETLERPYDNRLISEDEDFGVEEHSHVLGWAVPLIGLAIIMSGFIATHSIMRSTRYVECYEAFQKNDFVSSAKATAGSGLRGYEEMERQERATKLSEGVRSWISEWFGWFQAKMGATEEHSAQTAIWITQYLGQIENLCLAGIAAIGGPHMGMVGAVGMAGGVLYNMLESALGTSWAGMIFASAFAALAFYFKTAAIPVAIGGTILGFILNYVMTFWCEKPFGGRTVDKVNSGKMTRFMTEALFGSSVGLLLKSYMVPVTTGAALSIAVVAPLANPRLGSAATGIVAAQQLYRAFRGDAEMHNVLQLIYTIATSNIVSGGITIALVLVMIMARECLKAYCRNYAINVKPSDKNSLNAGHEQYEELLKYDYAMETILAAAATLADPMSVISIVILWCEQYWKSGLIDGQSFRNAVLSGAGVHPIGIIFTKFYQMIMTMLRDSEQQHSVVGWGIAFLSGIASMVSLYTNLDKVKECSGNLPSWVYTSIVNALIHIKNFIIRLYNYCINALAFVGDKLAIGFLQRLRVDVAGASFLIKETRLPDNALLNESAPITVLTAELTTELINTWKTGGLREGDLMLLRTDIGYNNKAGNLRSKFLLETAKALQKTGVDSVFKFTINSRLVFTRITTESLLKGCQEDFQEGYMEDGAVVVVTRTAFNNVKTSFQNNFTEAETRFGVRIECQIATFSLIATMVEIDGKTQVTVVTSGMSVDALQEIVKKIGKLMRIYDVDSCEPSTLDHANEVLQDLGCKFESRGYLKGKIIQYGSSVIKQQVEHFNTQQLLNKPEGLDEDIWLYHKYNVLRSMGREVIEMSDYCNPRFVTPPNMPKYSSMIGTVMEVLEGLEKYKTIKDHMSLTHVNRAGIKRTATLIVGKNVFDDWEIKIATVRYLNANALSNEENAIEMFFSGGGCKCLIEFNGKDNEIVIWKDSDCYEWIFSSDVEKPDVKPKEIPKDQVTIIGNYIHLYRDREKLNIVGKTLGMLSKQKKAIKGVYDFFTNSSDEEKHCSWIFNLFNVQAAETKPLVKRENPVQMLTDRLRRLVCLVQEIPEEVEVAEEEQQLMPDGSEYYVTGFRKALVKQNKSYKEVNTENIPKLDTAPTGHEVTTLMKKNNSKASRLSKAEWEKMKYGSRVRLPSRKITDGSELKEMTSRAALKMQQIYEQRPEFFKDCRAILDPTCGMGGFVSFLSHVFAGNKPKRLYCSTLAEKGHAMLDMQQFGEEGSNAKVVNLMHHKGIGHGNIQREATLTAMAEIIGESEPDGLDLVMLDMGEFYDSGEKLVKWWVDKGKNDHNKLEACQKLFTFLRPGGKALIKFNGYFTGGASIFHPLCEKFQHISIFKVGTTHLFSPEFYIYLSGYSSQRKCITRSLVNLYERVGVHIHDQQLMGERLLAVRGRGWQEKTRNDWIIISGRGVQYVPVVGGPMEVGFKSRFESKQLGKINLDWTCDYSDKLKKVTQEIQKRTGKRMAPIARCSFEKLTPVGHYKSKEVVHKPRSNENDLLSSMIKKTFGINNDNATYGCTQYTPALKDAAIKKRLDVDPGRLDPVVMSELGEILDLMLTKKGLEIENTLDFASKEQVLSLINKQGATGRFDDGHDLKTFIELNPNWYELCMSERVHHWIEGKESASYMTVRYKAESKAKKVNVDGYLDVPPTVEREELRAHNQLVPRFIMFGDALTRLAHYIVLGSLLNYANEQKVYKGTINGVPVHKQGSVLRACYDAHKPPEERIVTVGDPHGTGVLVEVFREYPREKPVGLSLDYSGWDGTVTVEERALEAIHMARFYKPHRKMVVMNALKDMCYAICVNDEGDVWLRPGQRGSGELPTSYGNTLLVQANTIRAVAKTLGVHPRELLETQMELQVHGKTVEIGPIPMFSDGDDTVIITTERKAEMIAANIDAHLKSSNKTIRSGTKAGVSMTPVFERISFCSHTYTPVYIGAGASEMKQRFIGLTPASLKMAFLPCKPVSDILSKLRLTMKLSTTKWNPDDLKQGGCVEMTRGKVISYLLLYPHIRPVRYACLTAMTIIGDGSLNIREIKRRFPECNVTDKTTLSGALRSVYGVSNLDSIGLRDYSFDTRDMRMLKSNVAKTGDYCYITMKQVAASLFSWCLNYSPKYLFMLGLDTKLASYCLKWAEYASRNDVRCGDKVLLQLEDLRTVVPSRTMPENWLRNSGVA
uniref:Genome polyprotein n=1 Tax=Plodia interpunctella associated flavi-like virus TaxID=3142499 RepID=A0AAT9JFC0_9FLAV